MVLDNTTWRRRHTKKTENLWHFKIDFLVYKNNEQKVYRTNTSRKRTNSMENEPYTTKRTSSTTPKDNRRRDPTTRTYVMEASDSVR